MPDISIYLRQHVGDACRPIVEVGDSVKRGQLVAVPSGLGANIHASFSGTVSAIDEQKIVLAADEKQDFASFIPLEPASDILETIEKAGITGAGGASFPTHIKLKTAIPNGIFVANAAECEPLLAHNIDQIEKDAPALLRGIRYCLAVTQAKKGIIAIKPKHKKAVTELKKVLLAEKAQEKPIELHFLPDLYPAGDERVIVREVTGIELEPGHLPLEANVIVDNVETIKHIVEAVELRKPFIDKDLTISGRVQKPKQVLHDVPLGTTVRELLEKAGGYVHPHGEIVIGGPMTGHHGEESDCVTKSFGAMLVAMPFPQEKRRAGILVCECGGSEQRLREIAAGMGAPVVAMERCKRMTETKGGRYRCNLPGVCPGQAAKVMALKRQGAQVIITGTCSD